MKALRASKRLILSIVGFVLSVVLCLGVCIAWFAMNEAVDSDGAGTSVNRGDIVEFTVDVYYLNNATGGYKKADTGNEDGEEKLLTPVDAKPLGELNSGDEMRPYGGFGNGYATAVLFDIKYEILVSDKHYKIYASRPKENSDITVTAADDTKSTFNSDLSNVVGYYRATETGTLYTKKSNKASSFIKEDLSDKSLTVSLENDIVPNTRDAETGNYKGRSLFIMDYIEAPFIYLSSLMISEGGNLFSSLKFKGDLTINIETYEQGETLGSGTYSYTFGGDNISAWYASSTTVTSNSTDTAISINTNNYLLLTATGTNATVEITGFTNGTNGAAQYLDVQFLDSNEEVIGVLHGTTPTNKATGAFTFDSNVFNSSTPFAYVKFIGTTSGKSCGILTISIEIE